MAIAETSGAMSPIMAFAVVGGLGVGSQWLAWRLRLPAIVLMLAAGGAALVHAVLPFMFETTASRILRGMCAEIDARAHNR